jgi:hypothetical protein
LDVFHQVAEVNRPVRVRKGCRDKDFGIAHSYELRWKNRLPEGGSF